MPLIRWLLLGVTTLLLSVPQAWSAEVPGEEVARFGGRELHQGGVRGVVRIERLGDGSAELHVTYTPILGIGDDPHHLYSKDLPADAYAGKPTRFRLPADAELRFLSSWRDDKSTHEHIGLEIYEDGPVTLSRRLILPEQAQELTAEATYMACTAFTCRQPVEELPVRFTLPARDVPVTEAVVAEAEAFAQAASREETSTTSVADEPAVAEPDFGVEHDTEQAQAAGASKQAKSDSDGGPIPWLHPQSVEEVEAMIAEAHAAGQPALLDFTGPSCANCQYMAKTVFQLPEVAAAWASGVPVHVNTDPPHLDLAQWQVATYGTSARPLYVHHPVDGEPVLWQSVFGPGNDEQVAALVAFLRDGTASAQAASERSASWWGFILLALAGGAFTLVMPCTYPMIPMTVNFFAKQSEGEGRVWPMALTYALGIMGFFVVLGVVVAVLLKGAVGVFSGHPVVNLTIAIAFLLLGLSLLDVFLLRLPTGVTNSFAGSRGGYLGALLMGLTFAITAFTCTAPFAGAVLAEGVRTGAWTRPIIGMAIYASVIAVPFFVLALSPGMLHRLPRAGAWMHEFKVAGGLVEIAAAFKFLVIADVAWGWGLFGRDFVLLLWAGISLLLASYILGIWRTDGDGPIERVGAGRLFIALGFLMIGIWFLAGFAGLQHLGGVIEGFFPADDAPPL